MLDRKELEHDRGFLVHLSMIYLSLASFLKGFHLTLESWRPDRNKDDWKLPVNEWSRLKQYLVDKEELEFEFPIDYSQAPSLVMVVPRFLYDLQALKSLLSDQTPPMHVVRSKRLKSIAMSFVNASGK